MRSGSKNGNLWVWDDNDDPGAGSKSTSKTEGNTGLNANWNEIDVALFTQHLANGSHKNDVIHGASLHTDCLDGSTLEFSAGSGTKVARIKDAGVTLAKISPSGASAGQGIIYNGSVVAWGNPTPTVADGSITRAKFAPYFISTLVDLDARKAGTSAGNTPATDTEWSETSASYVDKLAFTVIKTSQAKYLRMMFYVKSNALLDVIDWLFTVTDGVTPLTATGSQNSGVWIGASALIDISAYTDWAYLTCTLSIKSSAGTAKIKKPSYALLPT